MSDHPSNHPSVHVWVLLKTPSRHLVLFPPSSTLSNNQHIPGLHKPVSQLSEALHLIQVVQDPDACSKGTPRLRRTKGGIQWRHKRQLQGDGYEAREVEARAGAELETFSGHTGRCHSHLAKQRPSRQAEEAAVKVPRPLSHPSVGPNKSAQTAK